MSILGKVLIVLENRPASADTRIWAIVMALVVYGFEVSVISPNAKTLNPFGFSLYNTSRRGWAWLRRNIDPLEDTEIKNATYNCNARAYPPGVHLYSYRQPRSSKGQASYLFEYVLSMCQTWWLSLYVWRKHGFDVIHAANPPDSFFFLSWFYRPFGKRFIFDLHDLAPELFQAKFGKRTRFLLPLLYWLEKRSCVAANLILTTNKSQKEKIIERAGCPPEKVHIVRNGPDLNRLYRVPAEPALKRGFPFLLVYLGNMESQDGIEYALRVMHELVFIHGRKDVLLALLGDGGHLPELQELARDLSLEAFVYFTGWVSDQKIRRYLSTADIGLCPDPHNGVNELSTTIKSMEYMAMSLPCVAFDLKETRVTMREAALYATPNSVQDFARQILRLLDDPASRASRGQEGRIRIETYLSWDHARRNLLGAYATLFPALHTDSRSIF
ncbi:MAG TPA: glycosyltransferase family 4 protein [Ktedonobacteraceae bacterium]|nr:glycosyltransferase family 4 protein [Ktedonobacteraceae bacterium]